MDSTKISSIASRMTQVSDTDSSTTPTEEFRKLEAIIFTEMSSLKEFKRL